MALDFSDAIDFGKTLKEKYSKDDVTGGAAELTYRFFLALFPFFIFLAALSGFVASALNVQNPTDEVMKMLGSSLPQDAAAVIRTQVNNVISTRNGTILSLGILGAIWASASGINALMKNMNQVYEVGETRNFAVRYAIAVGLTIFAAGTIVLAFVIFFAGQVYAPEIAAKVGLQSTAANVISWGRWPAAVILIMLAVALLYWLAPNAHLPFKLISPGAVLFTIAWLIATFLFGLYVSHFGSYNATYGTLGGVVVLLIWFYITSLLLLLGGEINSVIAARELERKRQSQEQEADTEDEERGQREETRHKRPEPEPPGDGSERQKARKPRMVNRKPVAAGVATFVWAVALLSAVRAGARD